MTPDPDPVDDDVLDALRSAAATPAPTASKNRVAARLASAGVVIAGGATSLGGSASALAASSTVGGGGIASLGGTALLKKFAVGLVLGASAGAGAHAGYRLLTSEVRVPSSARAHPAVSAEPVVAQAIEPLARDRVPAAATTTEERRRPVTAARRGPPPAFERAAPATSVTATNLGEQQRLLDVARAALRSGDAAGALAAVAAHRGRFPRSDFDEERCVLEIRALVAAGNPVEASERLRSFERAFGASLQLPSLRRTLARALSGTEGAAVTANESSSRSTIVTDPASTPQSKGREAAQR